MLAHPCNVKRCGHPQLRKKWACASVDGNNKSSHSMMWREVVRRQRTQQHGDAKRCRIRSVRSTADPSLFDFAGAYELPSP
eukprot:1754748-Pleurochrysis_carterae.AAC.1